MNYEVMNLTYSPIRLILNDNTEIILQDRMSDPNSIIVNGMTEQIKLLAAKNFLRVKAIK